MLVIRPIAQRDLDTVAALATLTGFGMTSLPRDRDFLVERIVESEDAFARMPQRPRGEPFLFVLDDQGATGVVGTCGITSKVGGFEPFYAYRIETATHSSDVLQVSKQVRTLHLVQEHNGPSEIGFLFLHPTFRRGGNGRLLSLARFLFMAEFPDRFAPQVIAEMRGVIGEQGQSPFWDALGKHFFDIEFPKADHLSAINKRFIADLMPTHPIYIPLLPEGAQAVIGQVHQETRPALKLLEDEGFRFSGMVDIFEAGPIMIAARDQVRCVRESVKATAAIANGALDRPQVMLVSNGRPAFRACRAPVEVMAGTQVRIDQETARALEVGPGDPVRLVTPSPVLAHGGEA